jgi:hypothetical protein
MRLPLLLTLSLGLFVSTPVLAQETEEEEEDDDFARPDDTFDLDDFEDEDDDEEEIERLDSGDDVEGDDEIEDEDDFEFPDEDTTLDIELDDLEEIGEDEIGGEGQDNVQIYREYIDQMDDLGPEEELISWERYLEKYPNTLFRDRIETRIEELTDEMYGERIDDPNEGYEDASDREIEFAHPMMLENVDPRTRARVTLEMGFPAYLAGGVDLEYQIHRQLSAHVGYRKRYTGGNFEIGLRGAAIKSARKNFIATGMLDFRYNINPGYPALRPQIAVAKRFDVGRGLDVMAQGGVDLEFRPGPFSVRTIGGFHVYYNASDVVGVFAEGSFNLKASGVDDLGPFQFHVLTFGLKFTPGKLPAQVGLAADVPVSYNYWGHHFGAVQADFNYYLDDVVPTAF